MKPLAPNTILQNRYQIVRIIGKGGMGEVYLAVDSRLGHDVALKRTTVGDDPTLAAAFEREARILAGLRHPVLPKVSDHFLEGDEQFLIMDYISGDDLSQRLKVTNRPFPVNWVMFWADQLLDALAYLHTHEPPIIHRDIKPQNLKLTGDNQIVLLDFGLSKNSVGQTRVTTSGSVVGYTPHYAPMEQIRGTGTNAKSDIYALSATLYQLMTGTVPPDALTRADSLLANLPDPLRSPSHIVSEIPESVSIAILKGMDISQDRRFENAREMQKSMRKAFSEMKAVASAETVAFGTEDKQAAEADSQPVSEAKTEVNVSVPGVVPAEPPAADMSADKTEVFNAADFAEETGSADVVPPAAGVIPGITDVEPEGMKTEVLLGGQESVVPDAPFDQTEQFSGIPESLPSETSDFAGFASDTGDSGVSQSGEGGFDQTVPLIQVPDADAPGSDYSGEDFGGAGASTGFESEAAHVSETPEIVTATGGAAAEGAATTGSTPPPKKASKGGAGKYIGILALIGLLLFLVVGAVGAGVWYMTRDTGGDATPEPSATPTVEETIEAPPTVEPTDENVDNTNLDTNSNDNAEFPDADTPGPVKPSTPTPSTNKTPPVRKTPPVQKTPVKPQPTKPVVKPPTPAPTKKGGKKDPGVM
ncbi:MAG: protein kinase [Pyrinomonadaceae bacterium]